MRMYNVKRKLFSLVFFSSVVSCGLPGEDDKEEEKDLKVIEDSTFSNDGNGDANSTPELPDNSDLSPELTEVLNTLKGQWVGPCIDDIISVFQFTENQFVQGTLIYSEGSDCAGNELLSLSAIGGGLALVSQDEDGVVAWNGDIYSFERTVYTQGLADAFSEAGYHGYDDWEVGVEKQCINRASEPGGFKISPQSLYASLKISEDGQLGFSSSSPDEEGRSSDIDWYNNGGPFIKQ